MERVKPQTEIQREARMLRQIVNLESDNELVGRDRIISRILAAESNLDYGDPYSELSRGLYSDFCAKALTSRNKDLIKLARGSGIMHGFNVIGRMLSYAPAAYGRYMTQSGQEPSADHLGEVLKNSSDILEVFADMRENDSYTYEWAFGLLSSKKPWSEMPFFLTRDENDQLVYAASPSLLARAAENVSRQRFLDNPAELKISHRRCPALGYVLKSEWQKAIETCVTSPELFAADLRLNTDY
jgi:hypothetical protein